MEIHESVQQLSDAFTKCGIKNWIGECFWADGVVGHTVHVGEYVDTLVHFDNIEKPIGICVNITMTFSFNGEGKFVDYDASISNYVQSELDDKNAKLLEQYKDLPRHSWIM